MLAFVSTSFAVAAAAAAAAAVDVVDVVDAVPALHVSGNGVVVPTVSTDVAGDGSGAAVAVLLLSMPLAVAVVLLHPCLFQTFTK